MATGTLAPESNLTTLKEMLIELKINNKHLELLTDVEFEDINLEE